MTTLGTAIAESVLHDYGRRALLSRLSDPFWFQALGSVMGMDWHSSGITTSVMGALKRGLNPRAHELGIYICGGRGRQSRNTPARTARHRRAHRPRRRSAGPHQPADRARRQQRHRRRLPDLPALVRPDVRRRMGRRAAGHERSDAGWRAAITGTRPRFATSPPIRTPPSSAQHAGTIQNLVDARARPAQDALLTIVRDDPARTLADARRLDDAGASRRARRRRRPEAAGRRAGAGARARAARFRVAAAARTARPAHVAVARADRRSGARHADALRRSGALLVRAWRQGWPSVPGAAEDLRRVDRRAAPRAGRGEGRSHGEARRPVAPRYVHAQDRIAPRARSRCRRDNRARARDLAVARRPHRVRRPAAAPRAPPDSPAAQGTAPSLQNRGMHEFIEIRGARENNLKDVSLRIPKRQITIFTGVSGSGKSSIVFDTIATEAQRQLYENFSLFVRSFLPRYPPPEADAIENLSMAVIVDQKRLGGGSHSTVGTTTDIYTLLRLLFSRIGKPHVGYSNAFSFNDPAGHVPRVQRPRQEARRRLRRLHRHVEVAGRRRRAGAVLRVVGDAPPTARRACSTRTRSCRSSRARRWTCCSTASRAR